MVVHAGFPPGLIILPFVQDFRVFVQARNMPCLYTLKVRQAILLPSPFFIVNSIRGFQQQIGKAAPTSTLLARLIWLVPMVFGFSKGARMPRIKSSVIIIENDPPTLELYRRELSREYKVSPAWIKKKQSNWRKFEDLCAVVLEPEISGGDVLGIIIQADSGVRQAQGPDHLVQHPG